MKHARTRTLIGKGLALIAAVLTASGGIAAAQDLNYRTFTNSKGKTIEARILSKTDTHVTLEVKGGKPVPYPINDLSKKDQEFVKAWDQTKAVFLQKCRTLTVRELLELRGYESFKFQFKSNSIVVPGLLNGKKVGFLIDTGAHDTILHDAVAKDAGCKIGPYDEVVSGVGGTAPAAYAKVDKIQLGETLLLDKEYLCTDLTLDLPDGSEPIEDAILGGAELARLDAVISYRERLIFLRPDLGDKPKVEDIDADADDDEKDSQFDFRIFKLKDGNTIRGKILKKNESGTGVTIQQVNGKERSFTVNRFAPDDELIIRRWSKDAVAFERNCADLTVKDVLTLRGYQSFDTERIGNHIYVDGTLNGNDVKYMIDTGADGTLFNVGAAKGNECEVGPMDQWVYGIGGRAPAAVTKFKTVTVGKTLIENRRILSAEFRPGSGIGIYGGDFMRELDAVITYREMRLFLRQK